jgi:hypothetical protein
MANSHFFQSRLFAAMHLECCLLPQLAPAQSSTSALPPISVVTVQPWTNASTRQQMAAYAKDPCSLDIPPQEHKCEGPWQLAEEWLRRNSRNRCQAFLLESEIGVWGPAGDIRR